MQLGCLESVANSSVAYSSSSPLTYPATGTEFASPYFPTNHQYTPLHHQSFHYEFQHSHPAVNPDAYSLNSLHHSQQYYQQLHHGEPADFINLHNARALKSSCLDEQRRELGCLDAYRRHDLSIMSHGSQYGMHPEQRLLPGAGLGLPPTGADDLQVHLTGIIPFKHKYTHSACHHRLTRTQAEEKLTPSGMLYSHFHCPNRRNYCPRASTKNLRRQERLKEKNRGQAITSSRPFRVRTTN